MANLRHAKGDTAGASADFRRALELGQEQGGLPEDLAWCHVQLGRLSFDRGDWDEAATQYDSALKLVPGDRRGRDHLAELHAARKDYDAAVSTYRRLVEEFETPELCQALGDVYAAMDRPAEAAPWHEKALAGYLRGTAGHAHYDHHLAGFYADVRRDGPEAVRWARKTWPAAARPPRSTRSRGRSTPTGNSRRPPERSTRRSRCRAAPRTRTCYTTPASFTPAAATAAGRATCAPRR